MLPKTSIIPRKSVGPKPNRSETGTLETCSLPGLNFPHGAGLQAAKDALDRLRSAMNNGDLRSDDSNLSVSETSTLEKLRSLSKIDLAEKAALVYLENAKGGEQLGSLASELAWTLNFRHISLAERLRYAEPILGRLDQRFLRDATLTNEDKLVARVEKAISKQSEPIGQRINRLKEAAKLLFSQVCNHLLRPLRFLGKMLGTASQLPKVARSHHSQPSASPLSSTDRSRGDGRPHPELAQVVIRTSKTGEGDIVDLSECFSNFVATSTFDEIDLMGTGVSLKDTSGARTKLIPTTDLTRHYLKPDTAIHAFEISLLPGLSETPLPRVLSRSNSIFIPLPPSESGIEIVYDQSGNLYANRISNDAPQKIVLQFLSISPTFTPADVARYIKTNEGLFGCPADVKSTNVVRALEVEVFVEALPASLRNELKRLKASTVSVEEKAAALHHFTMQSFGYRSDLISALKLIFAHGQSPLLRVANEGIGNCYDLNRLAAICLEYLGIQTRIANGLSIRDSNNNMPANINMPESKFATTSIACGPTEMIDGVLFREQKFDPTRYVMEPPRSVEGHAILEYFDPILGLFISKDFTPSRYIGSNREQQQLAEEKARYAFLHGLPDESFVQATLQMIDRESAKFVRDWKGPAFDLTLGSRYLRPIEIVKLPQLNVTSDFDCIDWDRSRNIGHKVLVNPYSSNIGLETFKRILPSFRDNAVALYDQLDVINSFRDMGSVPLLSRIISGLMEMSPRQLKYFMDTFRAYFPTTAAEIPEEAMTISRFEHRARGEGGLIYGRHRHQRISGFNFTPDKSVLATKLEQILLRSCFSVGLAKLNIAALKAMIQNSKSSQALSDKTDSQVDAFNNYLEELKRCGPEPSPKLHSIDGFFCQIFNHINSKRENNKFEPLVSVSELISQSSGVPVMILKSEISGRDIPGCAWDDIATRADSIASDMRKEWEDGSKEVSHSQKQRDDVEVRYFPKPRRR